VRLLKVQREGRTGQSSAEFLRGLGSPADLKLL
jgi:hypothetical protein